MSPSKDAKQVQEHGEDDGSWINSDLLRDILDEGATILRIDTQRATGKGDNYLSALYRTRLEYRTVETDEVQAQHLIVKGLPEGEYLQNYVERAGVFKREICMYTDFLPSLYDFADSQLENGCFQRFSAGFHRVSHPDVLVMDDLKHEGFVMAPRRERLDFAHSRLVIHRLARLHALSAAYNEKYPGTISRYPGTVYVEAQREALCLFYDPVINSIVREMENWEGFESMLKKLKSTQKYLVTKLINICLTENCKRTVLIHGDCWVNNILFKYSDAGLPTDLRFVDFQISNEASPALDLNYFLFTSPQTEVRERHFDYFLREYCDEFERWARKFGYKGELISMDEIRSEVDRTAVYGFMAAAAMLGLVLSDSSEEPDTSITEKDAEQGFKAVDNVYTTVAFRKAFQSVLPYFNARGVFE